MKSNNADISLSRKVISILLGVGIIGFGFYVGVFPVIQIVISLLKGNQEHGNFGIFVFSASIIPLGFWVIFSVFKRE